MSAINLYRIDNNKKADLLSLLAIKFLQKNTIEIEGEDISYGFTLYLPRNSSSSSLSWNWLLERFGEDQIDTDAKPKAILLVELDDEKTYVITYGSAFFYVDKYCDKSFAFSFARKVSFGEIKTTTLTSPNSVRNRMISTYVNYSELEYDSGESFAKLKIVVDLPEDFDLFNPTVEIGNSIRLTTKHDSLERIRDIIVFISDTIVSSQIENKIPFFSKVVDNGLEHLLDERLDQKISENPNIQLSEINIIGASEIFNRNDNEYILKYNRKKKTIQTLNVTNLREFCEENQFSFNDVILKIKVELLVDGTSVCTKSIKELIDYTDDEYRCLLSGGIWYKFNDDYLEYLYDSIAEIATEYHSEFNFSEAIHKDFIESIFDIEKQNEKYTGLSGSEIKSKLLKRFYDERCFNLLRERDDGFTNYDREEYVYNGHKMEIMDLYKNSCMFAVKIGHTSSKLCYAVDQSINSLKMYKHKRLEHMPHIDTVGIWIILDQQTHIEDENGVPDLNNLNLLMFKNRLDQWKKEVRLLGYKPVVYVSYKEL